MFPVQISKLLTQAFQAGQSGLDWAAELFGTGTSYLRESIGSNWLFGSTESSTSFDEAYDEKHYFLIPFRLSGTGYSLYSMRCLPPGIPPINDLPKRRILHLPCASAMATVETLVVEDARRSAQGAALDETGLGGRLNQLADQIDRLDDRVFQGILVIGGLVALVNPLAGVGIAAKALIPSVGMLLSKFGLNYVGDTLNQRALAKQVRAAEKRVLQQFRGTPAESLVNPLLTQLDRALNTTEDEFDPLLEVDFDQLSFTHPSDHRRLREMTLRGISNVYKEVLSRKADWEAACLGPEDVRWLRLMQELAARDDHPRDGTG